MAWDVDKLLLEEDSCEVEVYGRDLGEKYRLLHIKHGGIVRNLLTRIPTVLFRKDSGEINQIVDGRFRGEVNQSCRSCEHLRNVDELVPQNN